MGAWYSMTDTLSNLVSALCGDYLRRAELVREGGVKTRVYNELRYLNYKIREATAQIVGEARAELFIREIGGRIGYAKSGVDGISETTYKEAKREVKLGIARGLYLLN